MKGKSTRSLHHRPAEFAVAEAVHTYRWWQLERESAERRADYDRSHPVPPTPYGRNPRHRRCHINRPHTH